MEAPCAVEKENGASWAALAARLACAGMLSHFLLTACRPRPPLPAPPPTPWHPPRPGQRWPVRWEESRAAGGVRGQRAFPARDGLHRCRTLPPNLAGARRPAGPNCLAGCPAAVALIFTAQPGQQGSVPTSAASISSPFGRARVQPAQSQAWISVPLSFGRGPYLPVEGGGEAEAARRVAHLCLRASAAAGVPRCRYIQ